MLPLIMFPLFIPTLGAAVMLTAEILSTGSLDISSFWFTLLCGLDLIFLALGSVLFQFVVWE